MIPHNFNSPMQGSVRDFPTPSNKNLTQQAGHHSPSMLGSRTRYQFLHPLWMAAVAPQKKDLRCSGTQPHCSASKRLQHTSTFFVKMYYFLRLTSRTPFQILPYISSNNYGSSAIYCSLSLYQNGQPPDPYA
jgi:hypothetical protein